MRLLLYAINGRGMGHLNRTLVIASAIRKADPTAEISFVVQSPLFGIVQGAGFAVMKIPDRHHKLGALALRDGRDVRVAELLNIMLERTKPDYFLIDFVVNEGLFAVARQHKTNLGLVLRKQRQADIRALAKQRCVKQVDAFFLPHDEKELPLSELPKQWRSRCHHLGGLARTLDPSGIAPAKARYALPAQKLVVVSIGGGGFPESYATLEAAERAAAELGQKESVRWVIVYGPYYVGQIPLSEGNVVRVRFEANLLELFAAADVIVCNAGYNTVGEIEVCGTPAVVIPLQTTGRDNQHERATALAQRDRALLCEGDAASLLSSVRQLLLGQGVARRAPEHTDAAIKLGRQMLELLSRPRQ